MEWRSVVFSDESRFLYASYGHTRVRRRLGELHLPEFIRTRYKDFTFRFRGVGSISYNSWSDLVFLQGKVNSALYIAQVVNPVLLSFLRHQGDVLLQQDNARPHTAAATQRAFRGVQLPWPARLPDLSPIEHVWVMTKRELNLPPECATTIA